MLRMLIKRPVDIPSSEITDKKVYLNRREFIQAATGTAWMKQDDGATG